MKKNFHYNIVLFAVVFIVGLPAHGQTTLRQSINSNWLFMKGDTSVAMKKWESVVIPHSFNTHDVLDDEPGYYRGDTWYKKQLFIPLEWKKQRDLYLFFEGVNQVATVFVNGKLAGSHIGGYTAFRVRLNEFLTEGRVDEVVIKVNNEYDKNIPPLTADFTFFGGIYRDVYLESFNQIHFNADDFASDGLYVSTPSVSETKAEVSVHFSVTNRSTKKADVIVKAVLLAPDGKQLLTRQLDMKLNGAQKKDGSISNLVVSSPTLWSPENPALYTLVISIINQKTKQLLDQRTHPVGFRWFSFFSEEGFFLNGKPYKIWGTSRHQDYPYLANALPDKRHVDDVKLLKSMGGNFLRVAHYPQDPAVLETCDRIGLLTSVEIPVVNAITESDSFSLNCRTMMVEMIRQNFNHPSVIMWASMNEVLLRPPFGDDKKRQQEYFSNVTKLARSLDSLSRKEDPSRKTMMAFHGNFDLYKRTGLIEIPDVAGWNLYQGWYSADIAGFGKFLDAHHAAFPKTPILITEYGADGDSRIRSFSPERFDKSVEYENIYHQVYINEIQKRPFVSGGLVWNLADFNSETREESMPHVNNKGLVDGYRNPKDTYYLYKAFLSKEPFVKIASSNWTRRAGIAEADDSLFSRQPLEVYTNETKALTLVNNGIQVATISPSAMVAKFEVPFYNGKNQIAVIDEQHDILDYLEIDFTLMPRTFNNPKENTFEKLLVNLGDSRFFVDPHGEVWLPEKTYERGGWGYIGGDKFTLKDKSRQPFGTDRNLLQTDLDPLFATQRVGVHSFRADVPDGKYEIVLYFAELTGGEMKEALVYNLSQDQSKGISEASTRIFDVKINGELLVKGLSNQNYLKPEIAYMVKTQVVCFDGMGLHIKFVPVVGQPILNAIAIIKVH